MHEGQQRLTDGRCNNRGPTFHELMAMAERELRVFISAVTELFGVEQAKLSAEDWLDELVLLETLPGLTSRDWRPIYYCSLRATRESSEHFITAETNVMTEA
jgi:hypothetical protein